MKNIARVVILGANGFIGSTLKNKLALENVSCLSISSSEIDLIQGSSINELISIFKPNDTLVICSAITPDKSRDNDTFLKNICMVKHVCDAISKAAVAHVIYLSSDAVYSSAVDRINEEVEAAPNDLYGTMHKARELILQNSLHDIPLSILRLTLVYGAKDTHNSYGPNRFFRSAHQDNKIVLFGMGEETRDHIFVKDVTNIIFEVIRNKSVGILNVATGISFSFEKVAKLIAKEFDKPIEIINLPRQTTNITHRHYDINRINKLFPNIQLTALEEGIEMVYQEIAEKNYERV